VIYPLLLLFALGPPVFSFESDGKKVEGYIVSPAPPAKALVLYFHRSIENREAVKEWARLLGSHGYAVAGYTATPTSDLVAQAGRAVRSLRSGKELRQIPFLFMGASLGTRVAAQLFAAETQARALVLIVPGSKEICGLLKSEKRPIFLIQAEKDEIVSHSETIYRCLSSTSKHLLLKSTGHRFPPSQVSAQIVEWLDSIFK